MDGTVFITSTAESGGKNVIILRIHNSRDLRFVRLANPEYMIANNDTCKDLVHEVRWCLITMRPRFWWETLFRMDLGQVLS